VGVCYNSDNHTQPGSSRLIWLVVDIQGGNRTNSANGSHRKRTRKLSNAVGTRGWLGWLVGGDFGQFVSPFSRCHQKKPPMMCPAELQRQRNPWSIRMIPPNLCVLLRGSSGKDDQTRPSINFSYCTIFLTCPFLFWGDLFWFSICFFFLFFTLLTVNVNQFGSKKRVTTLEAQSKEAPSEARVSNTVRLSLHLTAVKILREKQLY
jgi:hypothetical protein